MRMRLAIYVAGFMLEKLKRNYFFAVIRGKSVEDAMEIARHAAKGGIYNIEITFTTPDAPKAIAALSKEFAGDKNIVVGAGTVMSPRHAREALEAGAKFLVSPHFSAAIQEVALENHSYYFPGCSTPTEIVSAMEIGCKIIKIFPGNVLGPKFIKDLHGPIPEVDLMPSGGVAVENVAAWKKAGACAVGVGSALASKVATEGYESVKEIARAFVKAVEE